MVMLGWSVHLKPHISWASLTLQWFTIAIYFVHILSLLTDNLLVESTEGRRMAVQNFMINLHKIMGPPHYTWVCSQTCICSQTCYRQNRTAVIYFEGIKRRCWALVHVFPKIESIPPILGSGHASGTCVYCIELGIPARHMG